MTFDNQIDVWYSSTTVSELNFNKKMLPNLPKAFFGCLLLFTAAFVPSAFLSAQSISIASGAQMSLGSGSLSAGCGDLSVSGAFSVGSGSAFSLRNVSINSGTINGGSGNIDLSGDWSNLGTFNAQGGAINIVDGCGTTASRITGDNDFNSFSASTAAGRRLEPATGSVQTFTGGLSLSGAAPDRLVIRTSSSGATAQFVLNQGASQRISGVDVQDIDSSAGQTIAPGPPQRFSSVDSGNNTNWFIAIVEKIVPVNTMPAPLLVILALLILLIANRARMPALKRVSTE